MSAIGEIANFLIGGMTAGLNFSGTKKTNQTNLDIARETNQANLDIARETNAANIQMNKENNQLQQDLADKAYQRSTASNQIAELVKAGYTQQQAMMAVLGNGDSPSMPMPTTAAGHAEPAVMQPATMIPPDFSAMGQPFGGNDEFLGALANSLNAPDGGAIGWGIAQDYITGLMNFVDDGTLPADKVSSPADLLEYINTLEDGDNKKKLTEFLNSDASKKVKRFVPAQRAVYNFMSQNMGFKTNEQQIQESIARTNATKTSERLTEFQITGQLLDNVFKGLNIDYQRTQNEIARLLVDFQVSQNIIAANEADMSRINKEILEKTSPYVIEETIGRAQNALAQYEIEFAYKRMNAQKIREAMEKDLDLQITCAIANKVVQENIAKSESAFGEEVFNDDGTMRGLYRIYGAFKRFGVGVIGDVTAGAATATGIGALITKIVKK